MVPRLAALLALASLSALAAGCGDKDTDTAAGAPDGAGASGGDATADGCTGCQLEQRGACLTSYDDGDSVHIVEFFSCDEDQAAAEVAAEGAASPNSRFDIVDAGDGLVQLIEPAGTCLYLIWEDNGNSRPYGFLITTDCGRAAEAEASPSVAWATETFSLVAVGDDTVRLEAPGRDLCVGYDDGDVPTAPDDVEVLPCDDPYVDPLWTLRR